MLPLKALFEAGANILEPDPHSNTILHHFAESLSSPSEETDLASGLKYFFALGDHINAPTEFSERTVFCYLSAYFASNFLDTFPNSEIHSLPNISIVIEVGVDILHKNEAGETLLHVVAKTHCGNPFPRLGFVDQMNQRKELHERKARAMMARSRSS